MTVKSVRIAVMFICLAMAQGTVFAENAKLPYKNLYAMQKTQLKLTQEHTNLTLVLQIRSVNPDVQSTNITLNIAAKSGPIPIPVGPEGAFNVPLRDDLVGEDLWVMVNQPRGTMELSWRAGLAAAMAREMTNSMRYGKLMRTVQEIEGVQESMRQYFPNAPRLFAVGVRLTFRKESIAPAVKIRTSKGLRLLTSDVNNQLFIPLVNELVEENPTMELTESPLAIEIVTRHEDEKP